MTPEEPRIKKPELVQRVGLFVFIALLGMAVLPRIMVPFAGILVASALSTFVAAALANAISVRVFANGTTADFGMGWARHSARELLTGIGYGAAAGAAIMGAPLALGFAQFTSVPETVEHPWAALAFVSIALLFGAAGEEMLFRGYAFQLLVRSLGAFATILPVSVLFALAHMGNQNVSWLGLLNTFAWGVLLGYAYWRTGALWLPIGLHFGWNVVQPLFGANLSGFTMGVTGYALHWSASPLWSGGSYGPEGGLPTTIIVVVLFWAVQRTGQKQGPVQGPEV